MEEEKPNLKDAQDFVKRTYLPNLVIVYADGNCLHRCAASHFELDENLYKLVRQTHLDPFFTNQIEAEKGSHSFLLIFFHNDLFHFIFSRSEETLISWASESGFSTFGKFKDEHLKNGTYAEFGNIMLLSFVCSN